MTRILRAAVLAVFVLCSTSALAGWEMTMVTRGEGPGSDMADSTTKAIVDGSRARIEFVKSRNPLMEQGNYLLTKDAGKKVLMVNPRQKSFSSWDMESMMNLAGSAMKMMNMKISNQKIEKLLEEDGGQVAGFPTRRYRFRTSYTMEMNFLGIKQSSTTVQEEDVWVTKKLSDPGLNFWLSKRDVQTGNEQLDAMIKAEMSKVEGFPLKRIITTTARDSSGKETVGKMSSEVTEIKSASPSAAVFEVPAGFTDASAHSTGSDSEGGVPANPFEQLMRLRGK